MNILWPCGDELEVVKAGVQGDVVVEVTMPAVHTCPFKDELDEGTVTVAWRLTAGMTIELHSLRAVLDAADEWMVSHEEFTATLRALLSRHVQVERVTSTWTTAGGTVEVTA